MRSKYLALYIWECVDTTVFQAESYKQAKNWLEAQNPTDEDHCIIINLETSEIDYEGLP
jgi:hypothetical protein